MSRPSSAASSHRNVHRPITSSTTVPFTPRPKHQSRDYRNKEHDFVKIAETLASVRKDDAYRIRRELESGNDLATTEDGVREGAADPDRSFHLEESTFRTRPLVSRVTSAAAIKSSRNVSSTSTITAGKLRRERHGDEALAGGPSRTRPDGTQPRTRTTSENRRHASSSSQHARLNGTSSSSNAAADLNATDASNTITRPATRSDRPHPLLLDKGKQSERGLAISDEEDSPRRTHADLDGDSIDGPVDRVEEKKLIGVPLVVQEAWICEDLRYVLQVGL
jgi:hypothetical protein